MIPAGAGKTKLVSTVVGSLQRALIKDPKEKRLPTFTAIETRQTAKVQSR